MDLNELQQIYPQKEIGNAQDLTGRFFGKWKVLYRTENIGKNTYWVCECNCDKHTQKPVATKSLLGGKSKSCGCYKKECISNKADLLIHKKDEFGNIILKRCFRCKEWLSLNNFYKSSYVKDGYDNECKKCQNTAKENRYNNYKKGAKIRNLEFSLTKEEFYKLTSQPCYYCGEIKEYNGIDRIDSKKGYTIDNCVPCCFCCNGMKLDYTIDFWFNHMKKILNNHKEI